MSIRGRIGRRCRWALAPTNKKPNRQLRRSGQEARETPRENGATNIIRRAMRITRPPPPARPTAQADSPDPMHRARWRGQRGWRRGVGSGPSERNRASDRPDALTNCVAIVAGQDHPAARCLAGNDPDVAPALAARPDHDNADGGTMSGPADVTPCKGSPEAARWHSKMAAEPPAAPCAGAMRQRSGPYLELSSSHLTTCLAFARPHHRVRTASRGEIPPN